MSFTSTTLVVVKPMTSFVDSKSGQTIGPENNVDVLQGNEYSQSDWSDIWMLFHFGICSILFWGKNDSSSSCTINDMYIGKVQNLSSCKRHAGVHKVPGLCSRNCAARVEILLLEVLVTGASMLPLYCIRHWLGRTLIMLLNYNALITNTTWIPSN